ncbi:alpha/beta hydrolase [Mycolicibacterium neoaurum]|uniref:Lipocalin family protein n=1 Tax=Mycolicibacterium neoaurum TaxID=1795 RepID=A0AAV2WF29_MYCNE|nr:alpha/beta hydrolase [Mycolicibacterium neoaurum]TLH61916.1 alpha/beta hydrolase [Mycolicibacterium neoaurum]CDQ42864.1 Lipocalin family protein [Mycolicibacterium neoaurum]
MSHISTWMGAGVVAAGVSAAMIVGADVASADTGADSSSDSSTTSSDGDRTRPGGSHDAAAPDASEKASDSDTDANDDTDDGAGLDDDFGNDVDADDELDDGVELGSGDEQGEDEVSAGVGGGARTEDDVLVEDRKSAHEASGSDGEAVDLIVENPADSEIGEGASAVIDGSEAEESAVVESAVVTSDGDDTGLAAHLWTPNVAPAAASTAAAITSATVSSAVAVPQRSLLDIIASFVFDFVGVAVTFIAGPPVVPRGSTVTVRTSTLAIDGQHTVPAHWYYPAGDEPPQRIIYLQHGFLGVGAMYSYTAANLAESTNSIVVVPTLTSNRNVEDGFWLGSDEALRATAALFLGDREALTASAIAAGFAERYGTEATLPDRFALVGHSLGGNLVAGAAGYYADAVTAGGETSHLAGVILLDAAPQGSVLSDALVKLDGIGSYVPVLELGAPKEPRRVDEALNQHRPGTFNGIVLENGKHLDSMDGGSWLIQFISHLYQGFPTAQNQAAAQVIIDGWAKDILDGRIDPLTGRCAGAECAGIYGDPGQVLELQTPAGPTRGSVIGTAVSVRSTEFQPVPVTATVAARWPAGRNLVLSM